MSEIKYLTHREAAQARLNGEELTFEDGSRPAFGRINLTDEFIDTPSPYYRAPRVFTHPGGTCPAPETEAPPLNAKYWVPSMVEAGSACSYAWRDDGYDNLALSSGLVYLTREAAIARAELMLEGVAK